MTYKTPFGDYDREYGSLDYGGKVVLDIGADYGTTAEYFLGQGAARVIVSEKNPEWVEKLQLLVDSDPRLTMAPALSEKNATDLLREHRPDIVKVDCERCEGILLSVPDKALSIPEAWVMETHTWDLYEALRSRFEGLGYVITIILDHPIDRKRPERVIRVLTATRPRGGGV